MGISWKTSILTALIAVVAGPAMADLYGFTRITANSAYDIATQLSVDVLSVNSTQVEFRVQNSGPAASSITAVYFDDAANNILLSFAGITNGPGVSFVTGGSPHNLPGANNASPSFSSDFRARSTAPRSPNGVRPNEFVRLMLNLKLGVDFGDVLAAMNSGSLRLGLHVQSLPDCDSDSYVSAGEPQPVPSPGASALAYLGISMVAMMRRRVA